MIKRLTPIQAIRKKCLECCCNSYKSIAKCLLIDCPLYPYRMGMRPETYEKKLTKTLIIVNKGIPE